jgi:hypothetical protein
MGAEGYTLTSSALIRLVAKILLTGSEVEKPRWRRSRLEGTTLDTDFLNIDDGKSYKLMSNFHGRVTLTQKVFN